MSRRNLGAAVALAAIAVALVIGAPAQASATLYTPPTTVSADCSQDVSAELATFFAGVPDGALVQLQPHACYRIEREVRVMGKRGWILDGQGATLRRTTLSPPEWRYPNGSNAMLRFVNLDDSTVKDLSITGLNTTSDIDRPDFGSWDSSFCCEHGIALLGAQNVDVHDISIDGVFGDGVYIGKSDLQGPATRVSLRNVFIDRNGRQGIGIVSANGVLIDRVVIAHSRRAGIDMEPHPGDVVENVTIQNSSIGSWLMAISAGGVGLVNDIEIQHNLFTRSALPLVYDNAHSYGGNDRRRNWHVSGNDVAFVVRSSSPIMRFTNTGNVDVDRNKAKLDPGSGLAAWLGGGAEAHLECNHFAGAVPAYVFVDSTSRAELLNNSITDAAPVCDVPAATPKPDPSTATPAETGVSPPTTSTGGQAGTPSPSGRPPTGRATGSSRPPTIASSSSSASSAAVGSPPAPTGRASQSVPVVSSSHATKASTVRHRAHRALSATAAKKFARLKELHAKRVCEGATKGAAVTRDGGTAGNCRTAVTASLHRCRELRLQRQVKVGKSATQGLADWRHKVRHKSRHQTRHQANSSVAPVVTMQLSAATPSGTLSTPSRTDIVLLAVILLVLFGIARRVLNLPPRGA